MPEKRRVTCDDKLPEKPDFERIAALVEALPKKTQRIAREADGRQQRDRADLEFGNGTHFVANIENYRK